MIDERLLVGDHVRVINARQYPDFIYRILLILMILRTKFNLLQCIDLSVLNPLHLVDGGVRTIPQLLLYVKVAQFSLLDGASRVRLAVIFTTILA